MTLFSKPFKCFNLRLKETVENFTKRLFYALFDEEDAKEWEQLKHTFLEIAQQICAEDRAVTWDAS